MEILTSFPWIRFVFFSFLLVLMIFGGPGLWWFVHCPAHTLFHSMRFHSSGDVFLLQCSSRLTNLTHKLTRPPKSPFSAFPISCKMLIYRLLCPTRFHPPQLYFSSWYVRHVYLRAFLTPCGCSFRGCISQLAKRRQTNHNKQETIVL